MKIHVSFRSFLYPLLLAALLSGCTTAATPAPAVPTAYIPSAAATALPAPVLPTETAQPTPTAAPSATPQPARPEYLVLISLDGCRPEYFDLASMPNLEGMRTAGTYYPDAWVGSLPNNTPAGHTEMSTGSFPKHNGIQGYTWANLAAGEIISPVTEEAVNAGEMAAIVERSGVPTLAGLVKGRYPQDKVIALSAHKYYAAQALGMGPADYIVYSAERPDGSGEQMTAVEGRAPGEDVLADPRVIEAGQLPGQSNYYALVEARVLFEKYRPRALLVNLPEADDRGHTTGGLTAPDVIRGVLENTDRGLGELIAAYKKAGIYEKTLWLFTADHGMTPKRKILVDDDLFNRLGIQEESSDMLRLPEARLANPGRAFEIANKLASSATDGIEAVYVRTESGGEYSYQPAETSSGMIPAGLDAAYRYLLSTYAGRYSPDIVVMTAEGVVFDRDYSGTGGAHNEINWANQHIFAIFSGPGVKSGQVSYAPARLVDLLPTIARLMGFDQGAWDGVVLADALQDSQPEDMLAQRDSDAILAPLRDALEAQSLR